MALEAYEPTIEELKELLTAEEFEAYFSQPKTLSPEELKKQELDKIISSHPLGYLMSNEPDKVVSKFGVKLRRKTFYLLLPILKYIMNPYKVNVVRKEPLPKRIKLEKRTIVDIGNHSFKDDLLNLLVSTARPGYILFGSLEHFYKTLDGYLVQLVGTTNVARDDKESKKAAIPKWSKAINYGTDGKIFPEAIWNKDSVILMLNLWPGFYQGIKKTNSLFRANILEIERKEKGRPIVHVIRDKVIDIEAAMKLLCFYAEIVDNDLRDKRHDLKALQEIIALELFQHGIEINNGKFADYNVALGIKILTEEIRHLDADIKMIKDEDLVRKAIRSYCSALYMEVLEAKGIYSRKEQPSYFEMKAQWDEEIRRRQAEPEYYTWNEHDYQYIEPHEKDWIDEFDVFGPLDKVQVTPENQDILFLTKNMFRK